MSEPIDPVAVMADHRPYLPDDGKTCGGPCYLTAWPCEPYRLADALVAERAKVARVEAYANELYGGIGDIAQTWPTACALGIHRALADQPDS